EETVEGLLELRPGLAAPCHRLRNVRAHGSVDINSGFRSRRSVRLPVHGASTLSSRSRPAAAEAVAIPLYPLRSHPSWVGRYSEGPGPPPGQPGIATVEACRRPRRALRFPSWGGPV